MKINANKAQAFALRKIGGKDKGTQSSKLTLLSHEKDGLVEAIHIQDRPYSKDELVLASRVLKENKYVGRTLIAFQQLLIQYSWNYFRIHPDRLAQNLEPFNPIFLPVRGESGNIISLSPNPKLLKTMCNNWLPSIAREIIRDNSNIATGDVDTDIITAGQINNGIANTDNYYIFTSILGEFVATNNPTIFELRSSFSQICPAKNMFIESGKMIIPDIYVYLERLNKE